MGLRDFSVGTRLGTGFGVVLAFIAVLAVAGLSNGSKGRYVTYAAMAVANKKISDAEKLRVAGNDELFAMMKAAAANAAASAAPPAAAAGGGDVGSAGAPSAPAAAPPPVSAAPQQQRVNELLAGLVKDSADDKEKALLADIDRIHKDLGSADAGRIDGLRAQLGDALEHYHAALEAARDGLPERMEKQFTSNVATIMGGLVVLVAFGIWLARSLTRSVTEPLRDASAIAEQIGAGNLGLNISVEGSDELSNLLSQLKQMDEALARTVGQVRSSTETITIAAKEIAAGNADLSSRTESQASSLEQTASSMEELTDTVRQNADNARQANQLVVSASDVAVSGGEVVGEVVTTMAAIKEKSSKIVDIIGVIDGIAFQTNILALNAAVEAARAGEQGRGFAVVASEVRSLAQRSASAAKEIKTLINDSVEQVDAGSRLVDKAGSTMSEIVASVRRVTDIMSEIAAASQEQSSGISEVNQAIAQMDDMTQQNAALVEQAAAAAQSMQDQAMELLSAVGAFRVSGMTSAPAARPAAPRAVAAPAPARAPTAIAQKPAAAPRKLAAVATPARKAASSSEDWEEF